MSNFLPAIFRTNGHFAAVMPRPSGELERLQQACRTMAAEELERCAAARQLAPPLCEMVPDARSRSERAAQDLSLGRRPMREWNLHPMEPETYLVTLAGQMPSLRSRLDAMTARFADPVMAKNRVGPPLTWDTAVWMRSGPWPQDSAADFLVWVACPRRDAGQLARGRVLGHFHRWRAEDREVFGRWVANPYFCDL